MINGMTLDEFFDGAQESRLLFAAVQAAIESIGDAEVRQWIREAWLRAA